jgi:hypothetical protein
MLPSSYYVKPGDVLAVTGVSRRILRTVEEAGLLERVVLPGCRYGRYRRSDVMKVFALNEKKEGYDAKRRECAESTK